jgi:predicted transcriptional regulator
MYMTNNNQNSSERKRSRTEIIYDILETTRNYGNGAIKTKIMLNANLSHRQLKEYLTILIDNGLLQYDTNSQIFKITERGLSILRLCDRIGGLVQEEAAASN